jgi:hypothetical protein
LLGVRLFQIFHHRFHIASPIVQISLFPFYLKEAIQVNEQGQTIYQGNIKESIQLFANGLCQGSKKTN